MNKEDEGNPELKRKQRVATYNMYSLEGKLKKSLRKSFKWIKNRFSYSFYDDWVETFPFCKLILFVYICSSSHTQRRGAFQIGQDD